MHTPPQHIHNHTSAGILSNDNVIFFFFFSSHRSSLLRERLPGDVLCEQRVCQVRAAVGGVFRGSGAEGTGPRLASRVLQLHHVRYVHVLMLVLDVFVYVHVLLVMNRIRVCMCFSG